MGYSSLVTFLNQPKLSEHAVDAKFNARRTKLIPEVKDFILKHQLFDNKKVDVTFLYKGVSSLVCVLDTGGEKHVLKIPLSLLYSKLEGTFLKAWESVGVRVPKIFEEGPIGDHFYILMEYIEAGTVAEKFSSKELLENNTFAELGAILKKMHGVKTEGYSNLVNDKTEPEYENIKSWIENDIRTQEQIKYVKENNLLNNEDHGSIDVAFSIMISKVEETKETVYCHNDFSTGNIFATEPFTVFDPWPCFHHPYMDVARSVVLLLLDGQRAASDQLIDGYFEKGECDRQLLQAFIILNVYVKFKYQFETNKLETVETVRNYLSETKHFLEN